MTRPITTLIARTATAAALAFGLAGCTATASPFAPATFVLAPHAAPTTAPAFSLAASVASQPSVPLGVYTKLSLIATFGDALPATDPRHVLVADVARVVFAVRASNYAISQTVLAAAFPLGEDGRPYAAMAMPVPDADVVMTAQAFARNGKLIGVAAVKLPLAKRKASVTLPLGLKYPPAPIKRAPAPVKPKPVC